MLLVEEEEDDGGVDTTEFQLLEAPEDTKFPATLSINSIVGLTNPKTLKMIGGVGGGEVVVMVDPGATHNFISLRVVKELQVPVTKSVGFGVSLGNEEVVKGKGICKGMKLKLNNEVEV